jgi:hypothetical protein
MIRQGFGEESISRTREVQIRRDEVKSIIIIFFHIKVNVHKEFVLASQISQFRILL